jgi:hypothetical protein
MSDTATLLSLEVVVFENAICTLDRVVCWTLANDIWLPAKYPSLKNKFVNKEDGNIFRLLNG